MAAGKNAFDEGVSCYVLRFVVLRDDPNYVQWKLFDQLDMRGEVEVTAISLFLEQFAKEVTASASVAKTAPSLLTCNLSPDVHTEFTSHRC